MKIKFLVTILLLVLSAAIYAQKPDQTDADKTKAEATTQDKLTAKDYEDLLAKLKGGDTGIDFRKMRLAYTETKDFAPYGGNESRKKMNEALDKEEYQAALDAAEERFKTNYVDIDAHYTAFIANRELGKSKEAEFHRLITVGLLNSILENADGKTAKTAYFVISIREEYFIMSFKGYRVSSQSLQTEDGHTFDVLAGTNLETKESVSLYFNIDKVFGRF